MLNAALLMAPRALRARWAQLQIHQPELGLSEAAARLDATPLELIEARVHDGFAPLERDWSALVTHLCAFGRVSVRSERPGCVFELAGTFGAPCCRPDALTFDGPQIALHADPRRWSSAYAFDLLTRRGARRGLVFCDDEGELAWTLELVAGSNQRVLDAFLDVFADRDEARPSPRLLPPELRRQRGCATIEALAAEWAASGRSDALEPLLWRHGLAYERVLRQRARGLAVRLAPRAVGVALELASQRELALQAHAGVGATLVSGLASGRFSDAGAWWNLIGPDSALHLREDVIGEVWRLHGQRMTVEVFDREHRPLLSLREPTDGRASDSPGWTAVLLALDCCEAAQSAASRLESSKTER